MANQALATGLQSMLSADLTGGRDLVDLTTSVVLRNLLDKTKGRNKTLYGVLTVIVPYFLLTTGAFGLIKQLAELPAHVKRIGSAVTSPLNANITVPANHPLNQDVLQWLVSKGLGGKPKSLTLFDPEYNDERQKDRLFGGWRPYGGEDDMSKGHEEPGDHKPKPLKFVPGYGKYTFFYNHRVFTVERRVPLVRRRGSEIDPNGPSPSEPVPLYIQCYPTFNGTKPIEEFLDDVRGFAAPPNFACTTVFRPEFDPSGYRDAGWKWKGIKRPIRPLESIALEQDKKNAVLDDISSYLTPECERWYSSRGIPYRRGMLLYGPPGTGKTSFSVALAGAFGLNLYVLSLSDPNLNDKHLEKLFDFLPKRCIVLLEDVDSAGLRREALEAKEDDDKDKSKGKGKEKEQPKQRAPPKTAGITLSGMLNVLDGPASKDGRIVLMTSNAPDSLDAALIRPGRCDRKILFGYAGTEICVKLFTHIYCASPEERAAGLHEATAGHDMPALAKEFAGKIPAGSPISPAEVQGYLMLHRHDPTAAIAGAPAFAQEIIDIKSRGAKVAAFDNEVDKKEAGPATKDTRSKLKDTVQGSGLSKSDTDSKSDAGSKTESITESEAESGADVSSHISPRSPISPMSAGSGHLSLPASPVFGEGWLDQQMRAHGIDPTDGDAFVKWNEMMTDEDTVDWNSVPDAGSMVMLEDILKGSGEDDGEDEDEEMEESGKGLDLVAGGLPAGLEAKIARREEALAKLFGSMTMEQTDDDAPTSSKDLMERFSAAVGKQANTESQARAESKTKTESKAKAEPATK